MGRLGFEPRTNRLKAEYSTVELATLEIHSFRLFLTDSNHNIPFSQKSQFFQIKVFFLVAIAFCKLGDSQEWYCG